MPTRIPIQPKHVDFPVPSQEREERDTQRQDVMNRFPTADENDGTMNEFNDKVNEHLNREEERRRKIEEDKKTTRRKSGINEKKSS